MKPKMRKVDKNGRISLPPEFMEQMGIIPGEEVFINCENRVIVISDLYLPEWGMKDRDDMLRDLKPKISKTPEKKISRRSKPKKGKDGRSSPMPAGKYTPEWCYNQREEGLTLGDMQEVILKETGHKVDRGALSRRIKKHRESLKG